MYVLFRVLLHRVDMKLGEGKKVEKLKRKREILPFQRVAFLEPLEKVGTEGKELMYDH